MRRERPSNLTLQAAALDAVLYSSWFPGFSMGDYNQLLMPIALWGPITANACSLLHLLSPFILPQQCHLSLGGKSSLLLQWPCFMAPAAPPLPAPPHQTHAVTWGHIVMDFLIRSDFRPSAFQVRVYFWGFHKLRRYMDLFVQSKFDTSPTKTSISAGSFRTKGRCVCQRVGESHHPSSGHLVFEHWRMVNFTLLLFFRDIHWLALDGLCTSQIF